MAVIPPCEAQKVLRRSAAWRRPLRLTLAILITPEVSGRLRPARLAVTVTKVLLGLLLHTASVTFVSLRTLSSLSFRC